MRLVNWFVLLVFLSIFLLSCDNRSSNESIAVDPVSVFWRGDTLGSVYYSHSAMLLPIEISGMNMPACYIQLHAGVNQNLIYNDCLSSEINKDSLSQSEILLSGKLGAYSFDSVPLLAMNSCFQKEDTVIGCIGFDFFKEKGVCLNFSDDLIYLSDSISYPEEIKPVKYKVYLDNKILVPVLMGGETFEFLLNPQSPLFVVFNQNPDEIQLGGLIFDAPEKQMLNDANPAFDGILGYAFLKNKSIYINTHDKLICFF